MLSFKQYLTQFSKKFVCILFTEETNELLRRFAMDNGFDLTVKYDGSAQKPEQYKFHITTFYTTSVHNTPNQIIKLDPFELKPSHFELLGENHDVPVIKIKNEGGVKELRNSFVDQGYKDSWPDYKPHISLSYERKKYDMSKLKLPDFPIIADRFSIENQ